MSWLESKLRQLAKLDGYQKPEMFHGMLKLDSNENHIIPKQFQHEIIAGAKKAVDVREYPLGVEKLIDALSKFTKIPSSMIGVGNGSDQILDLILANFASKNTKILTSDPTFGFFEDRCKLYSIPMYRIKFSDEMKLDVEEFLKVRNAKILYLDSPNNPTGFQFPKSDLQKLIKSFDGLVIIDEAYGQFSKYSVSNMVKSTNNLVVVHTLSKSFGLAGLRLGYFIASKQFVNIFNKIIQYPYPLSSLSIQAGIMALEKPQKMSESVEIVKSERRRIVNTLQKYDAFKVFDSKANFVLFDARGAYKRIYTALAEQGIAIRQFGKIGTYEGCLRVTIGTKEMNTRFLLAIRDLLR